MRNTANGLLAATDEPRLYYRAREVAQLTGLGLRTVYEGIHAGWIPSRKLGNARLISAAWLRAATDREAEAIAAREREHSKLFQLTASKDCAGRSATEQAAAQSTDILWALARAAARASAWRATALLQRCYTWRNIIPSCYSAC